MITTEHIIEYLQKVIAEDTLQGDSIGLRHIQTTAGVLKAAAEDYGDTETAFQFRIVAADAANKQEEYEGIM
jgi:hypothetical protein